MPIYAYRCAACAHYGEHLQKLSDPALTQCPACAATEYQKQLSAVGVQIKGAAAASATAPTPHHCGPGCQH
ncbi:zinc ribbon domain-containing protein [uncultured Deefgea sp.]|uniref:FmdB family zinc ribbon protein n=1 Tax=uncultured Deefgea sp. TaxID=1304914 RepID=UPI0025925E6D|nr:zinc ribbon domain-containing protein [uncultured Deefgea sp.]